MKINFSNVEVRNFLSFGNQTTKFDYTEGVHAVTGKIMPGNQRNGVGKSSLLVDSIIFALYNKTIRKLNKNEVINTINKKDCFVACNFSIGENYYRVERTIKPSSLKIWKSNSEINEKEIDPLEFDTMNNTQKWLENELGVSYEAFTNIIVMNVNFFKPFLEMEPKEKRPVLSDMFSLGIYGKMTELAKKNHLNANGEVKELKATLKSKIDTLKLSEEKRKHLLLESDKFEDEKKERISGIQKSIKDKEDKIKSLQSKLSSEDFDSIIKDFEEKQDLCNKKLKALYKIQTNCEKTIKDRKEAVNFIIDKPHCPTCMTPTDNPVIKETITKWNEEIEKNEKDLEITEGKITRGEDTLGKIKNKINSYRKKKEKNSLIQSEINNLISSVSSLKEQIQEEEKRTLDLDDVISEKDIKDMKSDIKSTKLSFDSEQEKLKYNKFLRTLLGEEGIGKYVVKMILPLLNKKVNEYLSILGSDYSISFDTELNETLVSKTFHERSYASFSGGEKKRIDLAVLLAMVDVAKTQNSIDTNILILDEVLDTSMDSEGVESFMEHLQLSFKNMYPDKCIYIITHRKELGEEYFDSIINLVKKNNFTEIESIS